MLVAHLVLIPIDGCSINPARSFAAALASGNFRDIWIFAFGPLIGGSGAGLAYANLFSAYTAPTTTAAEKQPEPAPASASARWAGEGADAGPLSLLYSTVGSASGPPTPTLGPVPAPASRADRVANAQGSAGGALSISQRPRFERDTVISPYASASDGIADYR